MTTPSRAELLWGKYNSLKEKNKKAHDEAYADVKPLLELYAEKGVPFAQTSLGQMYYEGKGVKQDYGEAVKWFRKAAKQGDAWAQFNLGNSYYNGRGVERDYNESYMWFYPAYLSGNTDAGEYLKALEKEGWFSSAKVSKSEAREAKAEAQRKYDEIRRRNGWE